MVSANLQGMDPLLSIVQMPRGVPVATVAIGNATNAGHLAVRMLATSRPKLREALERWQASQAAAVVEHGAQSGALFWCDDVAIASGRSIRKSPGGGRNA